MSYTSYNFGVEIETVLRPYSRRPTFNNQDWYKQLAQSLENRNVPAAPDLSSRYSTHPEYYSSKWFITRDGSLMRAHEDFSKPTYSASQPEPFHRDALMLMVATVSMEIVSP